MGHDFACRMLRGGVKYNIWETKVENYAHVSHKLLLVQVESYSDSTPPFAWSNPNANCASWGIHFMAMLSSYILLNDAQRFSFANNLC